MKYSKNNLTEVIFHVKFSPLLKLYTNKKDAAWDFQRQIQTEFPKISFEENKKFRYTLENSGKLDETNDKEEYLTWIFSNGKKQIQLTGKELVMIYDGENYSNFEEFLQDVNLIVKGLKEYNLRTVESIGLRFINQIKINDEKSEEYFNPKLNLTNSSFDKKEFIQSLTKTELLVDEEYNLIFCHGQFNPEYPNRTSQKEYILDYDCILNYEENIENITVNLIKMHDIILDRFEDSITDKLREKIGD